MKRDENRLSSNYVYMLRRENIEKIINAAPNSPKNSKAGKASGSSKGDNRKA